MKKLFFYLVISFLFFSCSNVSEVDDLVIKYDKLTLKDIVIHKESDISWTKALEGERLLEKTYKDEEHISTDISLSPEVINIVYSDSQSIYPSIPNFGSLDITNLQGNTKYLIQQFCEALSKNIFSGPESYFDSSFYFNYIFFRNDFVNSWKDKFGVDFPQKTKEEIEKLELKNFKNPPLFTKWHLGKPFKTEEILQMPVRFYCQQGYVDVTLYVNLDKNKIYQILEGAYDGKK